MKLDGMDDFNKFLKNLEEKAADLSGSYKLEEIITVDFIQQNTSLSSFDELLDSIPVNLQDDLTEEDIETLDNHVKKISSYNSWQELVDAAGKFFAVKNLGF